MTITMVAPRLKMERRQAPTARQPVLGCPDNVGHPGAGRH
jgi:hypothetical protein